MKKLLLTIVLFSASTTVIAQERFRYKENFDSNTLEWTETAHKTSVGTAIIDYGQLTVKSQGVKVGLALLTGNASDIKAATFFETHCYAPIDVMKPFEIHSRVCLERRGSLIPTETLVGLIFNYRDNGNFYCFSFNSEFVTFRRYVDGKIVGEVSQAMNTQNCGEIMKWSLYSDGSTLTFKVDDISMLNVRYMPLQYTGFGYYTFGAQTLYVDWVEFIQ